MQMPRLNRPAVRALAAGIVLQVFFWGGYGGSLALTDLDRRMTVTYVMNKMSSGLAGDLRGASIVFAAYAALS